MIRAAVMDAAARPRRNLAAKDAADFFFMKLIYMRSRLILSDQLVDRL